MDELLKQAEPLFLAGWTLCASRMSNGVFWCMAKGPMCAGYKVSAEEALRDSIKDILGGGCPMSDPMTPERIAELRRMIARAGWMSPTIVAECLDEIVRLQPEPSSLTFAEMTEHVRKLNVLLQDPHQGLAWDQQYGEHMKAIAYYWNAN